MENTSKPKPHPFNILQNDPIEMQTAIDALNRAGINYERKNEYHLKIGMLNFWPGKGTIYRDGDKKPLQERGVDALLHILQNMKRKLKDARSREMKIHSLVPEPKPSTPIARDVFCGDQQPPLNLDLSGFSCSGEKPPPSKIHIDLGSSVDDEPPPDKISLGSLHVDDEPIIHKISLGSASSVDDESPPWQ